MGESLTTEGVMCQCLFMIKQDFMAHEGTREILSLVPKNYIVDGIFSSALRIQEVMTLFIHIDS